MAQTSPQLNKFLWIVNTIRRYGRITREQLDELWLDSPYSGGRTMPRRTFYNYRIAIKEALHINIGYDAATFEYFLDLDENSQDAKMHSWLLDSLSLNDLLSDYQGLAGRIFLEDVPSARKFLSEILKALKGNQSVSFVYRTYNVGMSHDVTLQPYFVKIFKQLWYVIGYVPAEKKIKTYALDRMKELHLNADTFKMPEDFDPSAYFRDCYGIVWHNGTPKNITVRATANQAKYFRALPLHASQREEIHDEYSVFHFKMFITTDLIQQILSYGSSVEVVSPPELKAAVITELEGSLAHYK